MKTTEMNILRTVKDVSLRQQIRNKTIRNELDNQDIVRLTRVRQWRDHHWQNGPREVAKWAKTCRPSTTRPLGKPPKRWHESWIIKLLKSVEAE